MNISPQAFVHPGAKIGQNVEIGPFSYIDDNVEIGDGTIVYNNATVYSGSRIGKNCKIFPTAVVGAIPQDLKFQGEDTLAIIGDHTTIREGATVNRGTAAKGKTIVGSNCLLMAYSHVAHDCILGDHCILTNYVGLAGEVILGDWVIMGGKSGAHQFIHIGAHAFIGGGALVRKDVPPFVLASREPLSYLGINSVGLKRRNFSDEKIEEIHNVYRKIYQNGSTLSEALEIIEKEMPQTEERDLILDFIKNSPRGIIRKE